MIFHPQFRSTSLMELRGRRRRPNLSCYFFLPPATDSRSLSQVIACGVSVGFPVGPVVEPVRRRQNQG